MNKLTSLQLSQGITDLIVGLETDLIANIAAYLAAGKIEEDTAKWKMKKLAELGKLTKQNAKTIAEYAGKTPELLELTLQRAANSAIQELAPGLKRMVQEGLIDRRATPSMSGNMLNSLKMLQKQAKKDLNLTNTTMKYKAKNAAMQVINRTAELANKQEYIDSLNKATGKVVTGIEARQSAMRECIGEMTQKGVPAFVDKTVGTGRRKHTLICVYVQLSEALLKKLSFPLWTNMDLIWSKSAATAAQDRCVLKIRVKYSIAMAAEAIPLTLTANG